jgi:hypothetical protein
MKPVKQPKWDKQEGCQRQSSLFPFRRNEMSLYRRFYLSSSSFTVTDLGGGPKMPAFRFSFSR